MDMTIDSLTESDMDLEWLSDVEATFHFTNHDDLRRTLRNFAQSYLYRDALCDYTIMITGYPSNSFAVDDDDEDCDFPRAFKILYLRNSQLLILKMPGLPHETISALFIRQVDRKIEAMNCGEEMIPRGGPTTHMRNAAKEADGSWGPENAGYLTCTLEAAVSESNRAVHRDAATWLEDPVSHVTQVITITISRGRPHVVFTVWGTTRGRAGVQHPPRAVISHEACVTLSNGNPIVSGRISLLFETLFERRPRRGTPEKKDIVFSDRELSGMVRTMWKDMGFIPRSP